MDNKTSKDNDGRRYKGYRYPGSRPFNDTDIDRRLFFGRDHEKQSLLHKVLADNLVVLYAKSGVGKTSLINAGLNHLLRNRGFITLPVRFNDANVEPLKCFYKEIENIDKKKGIEYIEGKKDSLWQYFKTVAFKSKEGISLKPVVILDQFEEFFILYSSEKRKQFIHQLAALVTGTIPTELRGATAGDKPFSYNVRPPAVKVIISIREDSLGQLEEMSREIPDIFHHQFRLLPLNREQARQAIIEPSQVQDEAIHAASFQYSPGAVDMMLNFLCKRKEKTGIKITNEVEPFQLQLLCKHIEDKIRERVDGGSGDITVRNKDLDGEPGMQRVLQRFYDDQVTRLGSIWKIKRARKLCEKGLISVTNRRLSLEEEEIKRKFKVPQDHLAELVNRRVLRSEPRVGSFYYELSHDSMIAPIRESQEKRNSKRDTIVVGGIIGICLLIALISIIQNPSNANAAKTVVSGLFKEGAQLDAEQKHDEASKKYDAIMQIGTLSSKQYQKLGQRYHDRGDFDKEIEVYEKAIGNGIKDADIYYRLGQVFLAKGKPKEAVKYYEESVNNGIKNLDIYRELAVLHIKNGNPDEAIDVYRRALKANVSHVCIYKEIVEALRIEGKEDFVEEVYDIASQGKHKDASCYLDIGHHYNSLKEYDKAIESFKEAKEYAAGTAKAKASCGLGNALYHMNKHKDAIKEYERAVKINPGYAEAYNGWGNGLYFLNRHKEAIDKYQKAIDLKPQYADAYNGKGNTLKYLRRYKEAIAAYRKATELDPDNAYAYYGWGNVLNYHYRKRYKEAIKKYEKAIEINPDFAYAHNELGVALRKKGEYERAVEECRRAAELEPGYADAYYNMGLALRKMKKYTLAIEAYNEAIKIKHNLPWVHMELGNVLYRKKRYDEAIKAYENAIKINPKKYAYAYESIEEAYKKMGRFDEADAVSKKAAKILQDADAFYNRGNDHLQEGEYKEAIEAFRSAVKFDSKQVDAYLGLASALSELGRYEGAVDAYNKLIAIQPDNADAHNGLASALSELGRYDKAAEAYDKVIEIQPDNAEAHMGLGIALSELGRNDEALEAYKKAVEIQPDAGTYYRMGYILQQQGKYNEAIEKYNESINIDPGYADAYKNMGDVLSIQKKYIKAIKAYKNAIEIRLDFAAAYDAFVELTKKHKEINDEYLEAIRNNPLDTAPRVELAEFCLIAYDFDRAFYMANELLKEEEETGRRILHEYRMVMTFIDISASFFLGRKAEAIHKTHQFIRAYEQLPGDYRGNWSYAASKRFISQNEKLPREQTHLLLQMIAILESPRSEGVKKLDSLRETLQAVVKSGDS